MPGWRDPATLKLVIAWLIVISWGGALLACLFTDSQTLLNITTPIMQVVAGVLFSRHHV
jgi:hypothetical protein